MFNTWERKKEKIINEGKYKNTCYTLLRLYIFVSLSLLSIISHRTHISIILNNKYIITAAAGLFICLICIVCSLFFLTYFIFFPSILIFLFYFFYFHLFMCFFLFLYYWEILFSFFFLCMVCVLCGVAFIASL